MAKTKKKGSFRDNFEALMVALIAALILRAFVIQAFRIPTGSMKDTLLVGDFLLVNKFVYGAKTPERIIGTDIFLPTFRFPALRQPEHGDIVIFKYPEDPKLDFIKRCVGLPGDTLTVRDNLVFINGDPEGRQKFLKKQFDAEDGVYINYFQITTPDSQKYIIRKYADRSSRFSNFGPVIIPDDALFMMGDNRDNSADSRYWGMMPMENVVGQPLVIYFSWDKHEPFINIFKAIRWNRIFSVIK